MGRCPVGARLLDDVIVMEAYKGTWQVSGRGTHRDVLSSALWFCLRGPGEEHRLCDSRGQSSSWDPTQRNLNVEVNGLASSPFRLSRVFLP